MVTIRIGMGCSCVGGRLDGRLEAMDQEELMGNLSRNGWV
jgi:hypothetical protein